MINRNTAYFYNGQIVYALMSAMDDAKAGDIEGCNRLRDIATEFLAKLADVVAKDPALQKEATELRQLGGAATTTNFADLDKVQELQRGYSEIKRRCNEHYFDYILPSA